MKKNVKRMKKAMIGIAAAIVGLTACETPFSIYAKEGGSSEGQEIESTETSEMSGEEDAFRKEHISCVGSVSKVYVTAAAMQLVEAGKLDLNAPVTEYIPEFTMADERYKEITVSMLMNHTSGIMGTNSNDLDLLDDNELKSFNCVLENLSTQRLKSDPGGYASYCNDGFDLLALIVERVSGMSYTDYVTENIAGKFGVNHTGTAANFFGREDLAPLYRFGNNRSDYEYCTSLGAGGIYATASDMATFGSGFFTGNDTILSKESKEYMAKKWWMVEENADSVYEKDYMAVSASGWDFVTLKKYEDAGVKVLGKGGDLESQYAFLFVAPDEKISVGVLSTGGSSMYNGLFAQELMDEVLAELGKEVDDTVNFLPEMVATVPDELRKYEGYYTSVEGDVSEIRMEDDKLMMYSVLDKGKDPSIYLPCKENQFVKADENGNISTEKEMISFEEGADGTTYIKRDSILEVPSLGYYSSSCYAEQKLEENAVSEEVINSWKQYDDKEFVLMNAKYSAQVYGAPFLKLRVREQLPGYVQFETGMGSRLLKMVDETTCEAFTTIPSDANRDLIDGSLQRMTLQDGREVMGFIKSDGAKMMLADDMKTFSNDVKTVKLTSNEAVWYKIGEDVADTSITATCPANSAMYVFNKYKEIVYTSHVESQVSEISLPKGGYMLFLGETGGEITVK